MKLKITIVLLVLSSILFFYVYKRDVSPGVKIDFKEKKNLSVDAYAFAEKFIRFQTKPGEYKDLDIVLWNISKNEVVKKLFTVTRERRIEKAFVVKPDETSIFVSSKDTIYQVSTIDGHLLNQLDIPNLPS